VPRRKKRKPKPTDERPSAPPERLARPFAEALRDVKPARTESAREAPTAQAPKASLREGDVDYGYEDRVALRQAMDGVRPLGSGPAPPARAPRRAPPSRVRAEADDSDRRARERLAALVTDGLRFEIERDDGFVRARRVGASKRAVADLRGGRAEPEAEIDLHGFDARSAGRELVEFVREQGRRNRRVVRVIHGQGRHSEGGVGVLGDVVIETLTAGAAAPFVDAFVTAARAGGGAGAILVRLRER
jgi:DNA-nicking Smr family endonuclease